MDETKILEEAEKMFYTFMYFDLKDNYFQEMVGRNNYFIIHNKIEEDYTRILKTLIQFYGEKINNETITKKEFLSLSLPIWYDACKYNNISEEKIDSLNMKFNGCSENF